MIKRAEVRELQLILKVGDSLQRHLVFVEDELKFHQETSKDENVAGTSSKGGELVVLFTSEKKRKKYYDKIAECYEIQKLEKIF